jgi:hypothetical protein
MFGFVILNYLNYLDTIELLDSIAVQEWSDSVYIYVVDNGSPNDSVMHLNNAISKSSLQIKFIESSINLSSVIHQSFLKIQIAIGKSKLGQDFLIFAGAKLTVILVVANLVSLDFIADFNLSLLSCTH